MVRKLRVALLATVFSATLAFAQTNASVTGTVTDPTGAHVVGATVTAFHLDTGVATIAWYVRIHWNRLMIGQDDWQKGRDRRKGEGFRIYCGTKQDVDALAAAIKARGGMLDTEPTDQPWGSRDFSISDPDGFKITIGKETRKR